MKRHMTARARLETFAHVSRTQSDQETYDMAVNRDVELKRQRARAERAEAERDALRGALLELRIRLHVSGRRPEECYEMSIIDAALGAARKEGEG